MYYELYIDVFFLENLLMDSLILLAVNRALKCGASRGRAFLGGVLGSALTCLTLVSPFPPWVKNILFYAGISSVMLCAGLGIKTRTRFIQGMILLYMMAVILGGVMQLFRPYLRYVSLFYAVAGMGYLILTGLWEFLGILHNQRERIVCVTLYPADGRKVDAKALWDTGNDLRDFVTGRPVSVLAPGLAGKISGSPEGERGFHLIPYRCVGGESLMRVFCIEKMCIHTQKTWPGEELWIFDPVLGIGENALCSEEGYDMILNPELLV